MARDPMYANEKLWEGIHVLVTHPGPIRARLVEAFHRGFAFVTGLTGELDAEFVRIFERCTKIQSEQRGSFAPTIEAMSEAEAVEIATSLLTLAYKTESQVQAFLAGEEIDG